jgi:predicted adenine nucleotide alpha hydrolase (AANH) superfamily ATPase
MKLLLHCCCAPCTVECAGAFLEEGRRPALFWYNPNIHPFTEYRSRRETLAAYAQATDLPVEMIDEYGLRPFLAALRRESGDSPKAARDGAPDRDGTPGGAAATDLRAEPEASGNSRTPSGAAAADLRAEPETRTPDDAVESAAPERCARCYRMRLERTAARAAEGGYDAFSTTLLISPYQRHELVAETAEEEAKRHGVPFLYRDFRPLFRKGQARARELGFYMQKYCGCVFSEEERYLPRSSGAAEK